MSQDLSPISVVPSYNNYKLEKVKENLEQLGKKNDELQKLETDHRNSLEKNTRKNKNFTIPIVISKISEDNAPKIEKLQKTYTEQKKLLEDFESKHEVLNNSISKLENIFTTQSQNILGGYLNFITNNPDQKLEHFLQIKSTDTLNQRIDDFTIKINSIAKPPKLILKMPTDQKEHKISLSIPGKILEVSATAENIVAKINNKLAQENLDTIYNAKTLYIDGKKHLEINSKITGEYIQQEKTKNKNIINLKTKWLLAQHQILQQTSGQDSVIIFNGVQTKSRTNEFKPYNNLTFEVKNPTNSHETLEVRTEFDHKKLLSDLSEISKAAQEAKSEIAKIETNQNLKSKIAPYKKFLQDSRDLFLPIQYMINKYQNNSSTQIDINSQKNLETWYRASDKKTYEFYNRAKINLRTLKTIDPSQGLVDKIKNIVKQAKKDSQYLVKKINWEFWQIQKEISQAEIDNLMFKTFNSKN